MSDLDIDRPRSKINKKKSKVDGEARQDSQLKRRQKNTSVSPTQMPSKASKLIT